MKSPGLVWARRKKRWAQLVAESAQSGDSWLELVDVADRAKTGNKWLAKTYVLGVFIERLRRIVLSGDRRLHKHSNLCLHGLITELKTMMMMMLNIASNCQLYFAKFYLFIYRSSHLLMLKLKHGETARWAKMFQFRILYCC